MVEAHCAGLRIIEVNVLESGDGPRHGEFDDIVFDKVTAEDVRKAFLGRSLQASKRKGKQMWWQLSGEGPHPTWHFGMTGGFSVNGLPGNTYKRYSIDTSSWPPKFTKIEVVFGAAAGSSASSSASTKSKSAASPASSTGGSVPGEVRLAFSDPRRLGRIRLVNDPEKEYPVSELGWDPHLGMISLEQFAADLRARALPIKAMLLDQSWCAGIGNWIADEVLFQSRVHPESAACALDVDDVRRLHASIRDVVKFACEVDANSSKFPKEWLFHHRWGKGKGAAKTSAGHPIQFITVGGRTSAVVNAVQGSPKRATAAVKPAGVLAAASASAAAASSSLSAVAGGNRKRTKRVDAGAEVASASMLAGAASGATAAVSVAAASKKRGRPAIESAPSVTAPAAQVPSSSSSSTAAAAGSSSSSSSMTGKYSFRGLPTSSTTDAAVDDDAMRSKKAKLTAIRSAVGNAGQASSVAAGAAATAPASPTAASAVVGSKKALKKPKQK